MVVFVPCAWIERPCQWLRFYPEQLSNNPSITRDEQRNRTSETEGHLLSLSIHTEFKANAR